LTVFIYLIYVWHGSEMQFEWFNILNHSVVAFFPQLHHLD
jgi:hypothetical protein